MIQSTHNRSFLKKISPYWRLAFRNPLFFANATIAALITNFLLTLQPGLLKVFINEAQRGADHAHLFNIVAFMLAALALAFLFDTIQVSTSHYFRLSIEQYLREVHYRFSNNRDVEEISFPIQKGIFGLAQFSLLTSLELLIAIINLIIVILFIYFSNTFISLVITSLLIVFALISLIPIKVVGNISKQKERDMNDCISIFNTSTRIKYLEQLYKIQSHDGKLFLHETLLVFMSFTIFKVLPTLILIYFLKNDPNNIGEMASYFLYFSLLHGPYKKLIKIIKQSSQFFSQAEIFREDIENSLNIDIALKGISHGFICHTVKKTDNKKLDKLNNQKGDLVVFESDNLDDIKNSQLVIDKNYKLIPTPVYLWNQKNERY